MATVLFTLECAIVSVLPSNLVHRACNDSITRKDRRLKYLDSVKKANSQFIVVIDIIIIIICGRKQAISSLS